MSTTRITINVKDEILHLLEVEAKEQDKARAHLAGSIIEMYYTAEEIPTESMYAEYESKISYLESELIELKKDKSWYQGEISQLTEHVKALPAPKKPFKWFWNRK